MIDPRLEPIIREHLPHLPADDPLQPDSNLADLGMDSLAVVALLVSIEEEFSMEFSDELLVPETFETPAALWDAISASCEATAS